MKKLLTISAFAAVFACATMSAFADDLAGQSGVSGRVGGFYPTQTATRDATTSTWFSAGVDYKLKDAKLPLLQGGSVSLSVDYASNGNFRNLPVMVNYTVGKQIYYSVGVGAGFTRFVEDGGGQNDMVRFAYGAAIGYNFNNAELPAFLEVRYLGNQQPRVAGIGVYVGVRF